MAAISGGVASAVASLAMGADPLAVSTWYWSVVDSLISRVQAGYAQSRQGTMEYLRRHAALSGYPGVQVVPGSLDVAAVRTSLEVTGPVAFKTAIAAGHDTDYATRSMASQMAGAAQRHTRAGERDTIFASAERGDGIIGYRRQMHPGLSRSGKSCGFCAMLASRGAVYLSRASAGTVVGRGVVPRARGSRVRGDSFHDHCHCSVEVLYAHEREPAEVRRLQAQWERVTTGQPDKALAWNRYWNSRAVGTAKPVPHGSKQWSINQAYDRALADAAKAEARALRYADDAYQRAVRLADDEYRRAVRLTGEATARNARVAAETAARDAQRAAQLAANAARREAERLARQARDRAAGRLVGEPKYAVRPSLATAKSPAEVSRVLADELERVTGRRIPVELRGSVETAREHAEGVLRTMERYPETPLDGVATERLLMAYGEYDPATRRIIFSEQWSSLERRQRYLDSVANDGATEWSPYSNPMGLAVHEMGHAVDVGTGQAIRADVERLLATRSAREVSEYATRNVDELVAEAFADVTLNGAAAKPLSREIVALLDDAYATGRRGAGLTGRLAAEPRPRMTPAEFDARAARAKSGSAAESVPPVRVEVDASAGAETSRWRVSEIRGAARAAGGQSALTRYLRDPSFANARLRGESAAMIAQREQMARFGFGPTAEQVARDAATADRHIAAIDRLMEQSRLPRDIVVWRGARTVARDLPESAVGYEWVDAGFVSTAVRRGYAEADFAVGREAVLMRILVPEGTPALSLHGGEGEILLARGLRYRVVAESRTPQGLRVIDVEIVPAVPAKATKAVKTAAPKPTKAAAPKPAPAPFVVSTEEAVDRAVPASYSRRGNSGIPLTDIERAAVRRYTDWGTAVEQIQAGLRSGNLDQRLRGTVEALDAAMSRSRLTEPLVVERGIYDLDTILPGRFGDDLVGAEWIDNAFMSTTFDEAEAAGYAYGGPRPAVLRIRAPEGTPAIQLSGAEYESEVLLGRGLRLRVVADRGLNENGARLLDVEIVPAEPAKKAAKKAVAPKPAPSPYAKHTAAQLKQVTTERQITGLADGLKVPEVRKLLDRFDAADAAGRRAMVAEAKSKAAAKVAQAETELRAALGGPADPVKLRAAVAKAKKAGVEVGPVKKVGTVTPAGKSVKYDPKVHQLPDGVTAPTGAKVRVVEPGYQVTVGRETLWVRRPVVEVAPTGPTTVAKAAADDVSRMTVAQLRALAKELDIPLSPGATKAQMLARLEVPKPTLAGLTRYMPGAVRQPAGVSRTDWGMLQGYAGGDFGPANRVLRGIEKGERPALAGAFDRLMAESRTTEEIIVYRGLRTGQGVFGPRDTWPDDFTGAEWVDQGFLSTSVSESTARDFAGTPGAAGGVLMRIRVPRGTGALDLQAAPLAEGEVLLERGLRLRVVGQSTTQIDGRTVRLLDVEVVPVKGTVPKALATPSKAAKATTPAEFVQRVEAAAQERQAYRLTHYEPSDKYTRAGLDAAAGSYHINDALRAGRRGSLGAAREEELAGLDRAFAEQTPLDRDIVVRRGVTQLPPGVTIQPGVEWVDEGFVSTTSGSVAQMFTGDAGIEMRILVPRGTRAISNPDLLKFNDEVLLERGLRYRIVADHGMRGGRRHIDVEVVLE